jgi:hypothetical protein
MTVNIQWAYKIVSTIVSAEFTQDRILEIIARMLLFRVELIFVYILSDHFLG